MLLNIWDNTEGLLAIAGTLIAVIALLLAIKQYKDARFHTRSLKGIVSELTVLETRMSGNLNHLSDDLNIVKGELSTKFLSEFPHFIEDINKLIKSTVSELTILCDFPAYSYFSDFEGWNNYRNAIEQKTENGVSVTMICLTKEQLEARINEQFLNIDGHTPDEAWAKRFADNKFKDRLTHFIKRHDTDLFKKGFANYTPNEVPLDKFIELSIAANYNILKSDFLDIDILEINSPLSFLCWIADNNAAVFAIPRSENDSKELAFITSDKTLITALKSIVRNYKANSTKLVRKL